MDRNSVSYSLQGSSSAKVFKAFNALGAIAFSFGDAMLPEIQVKQFILESREIDTAIFMNTWNIFELFFLLILLEYSEEACKKEYVQGCISSIHCHCFKLLAISLLWLLGVRFRSRALYCSFSYDA